MTDKFIRIRYSVPSSCPRISPSRMPIEKIINSREIKEICAGPAIYFMEIHGQDKQIPLTCEQYDYIAAQLVDLSPVTHGKGYEYEWFGCCSFKVDGDNV